MLAVVESVLYAVVVIVVVIIVVVIVAVVVIVEVVVVAEIRLQGNDTFNWNVICWSKNKVYPMKNALINVCS